MSKFNLSTGVMERNYEGSGIYEVSIAISENLLRYFVEHQDMLVQTLVNDLARELIACYESKIRKP